jgi:hypothetical protein
VAADAPPPDSPVAPADGGQALLFVDASSHDFGAVPVGDSAATTVTIRNVGTGGSGPLAVSGGTAAFAVDGGSCAGASLAPGAACTLTVRFTPTTSDSEQATVTVAASAGASVVVMVTGRGAGPADLVLSPAATLDFGPVVDGATAGADVQVANTGEVATGVLATSLAGSNAADFRVARDGCAGAVLAPAATCSLTLEFAPATAGAKQGELTIRDPGSNERSLAVVGAGLAPGALAIAPVAPSFGAVGVGHEASVRLTVTNTGATATGAMATTLGGSDRAELSIADDGCAGRMLGAAASCSIDVAFRPTSAGVKTASLSVSADPGAGAAVRLAGTGSASLAVTRAGTGSGAVVSVPPGIDCGAGCQASFATAPVVLTAQAATGSSFAGWSGGCSGSSTCYVPLAGDTSVTATFALQRYTLSVAVVGAGTVTSDPAGIACGGACTASYDFGQTVTLTAAPSPGSTFGGWSGACSGTGTCSVPIDAARSAVATFVPESYALTLQKSGSGTGTVTSSDGGVSCGAACPGASASYRYGTTVTLTAAPAAGAAFAGWSGACSGTSACVVTIAGATSVGAVFTLQSYALTVTRTGAGTVASSDGKIACGATCSAAYGYGAMVALSAIANTGSTFTGWSGACNGTGTCTVTMGSAQSVAAGFDAQKVTLSVTKSGSGTGTVSSMGDGLIACGATCAADYAYGTMVTLVAAADAGSTFAGWSGGGCAGAGTCIVTLDAARQVTASFGQSPYSLVVSTTGNGMGTVASGDGRISCPGTCSVADYTYSTMVTLTATADSQSSTFAGWSGSGCSGTGTCVVTIDAARTVAATFTLKRFTLAVTKTGPTGAGTVSATDGSLSCAPSCASASNDYDYARTVTLTAAPQPGYRFAGWSGDCMGSGSCAVPMTGPHSVTAGFALLAHLSIVETGQAPGKVTVCDAAGCTDYASGQDWTVSEDSGATITMTATPGAGVDFGGWTGACGTSLGPSCTLAATDGLSVTARFRYRLTVVVSPPGAGTVRTKDQLISCPPTCAADYEPGAFEDLEAAPAAGYRFGSWSGCTPSSNGDCTLTFTGNATVTATFVKTYTLSLTADGPGSVSLTAPPPACSIGCTVGSVCGVLGGCGSYDSGSQMSLTATPSTNYVVTGWSGAACVGTTCSFTLSQDATVTAVFGGCTVDSVCAPGQVCYAHACCTPVRNCGGGVCSYKSCGRTYSCANVCDFDAGEVCCPDAMCAPSLDQCQ